MASRASSGALGPAAPPFPRNRQRGVGSSAHSHPHSQRSVASGHTSSGPLVLRGLHGAGSAVGRHVAACIPDGEAVPGDAIREFVFLDLVVPDVLFAAAVARPEDYPILTRQYEPFVFVIPQLPYLSAGPERSVRIGRPRACLGIKLKCIIIASLIITNYHKVRTPSPMTR